MRVNVQVENSENRSNIILINNIRVQSKPVYDFFKRLFDILLSLTALIVLSPVPIQGV